METGGGGLETRGSAVPGCRCFAFTSEDRGEGVGSINLISGDRGCSARDMVGSSSIDSVVSGGKEFG